MVPIELTRVARGRRLMLTLKVSLAAAAMLAAGLSAAATVHAFEQAWYRGYIGHNGARAFIDTALPPLGGGWSYMRVGGQRFIDPNNPYFLEIGWILYASQPYQPYLWFSSADINGNGNGGNLGPIACCANHYYEVSHGGSNIWNMYFYHVLLY